MRVARNLSAISCVAAMFGIGAASELRADEPIQGANAALTPPVVICPPRFSVPLYVPADELLRDAAQRQPVTPEGWIVQNRPVGECVHYHGNAAQRKYEQFELPLALRRYDSQIRVLEAEVASLQRKLVNYRYFNQAGALVATVENTRLALIDAKEELESRRYERRLFLRWLEQERQLAQGVTVTPSPPAVP